MRFIPLIGFAMLLLLLAVMLMNNHASPTSADSALPVLSLNAMGSTGKWDQKSLIGQVTMLNFFASWCTPCAAEMPELAALKKQFPKIVLHGVAWNDDPKTLTAWLHKNGNPFRSVWLDPNGDATIALGIKGVPETLVVDASGVVRYRVAGPITKEIRANTLDPLIRDLQTQANNAQ